VCLSFALATGPIAWAEEEEDPQAIEAREWAACKNRVEVAVGESKVVQVPGKVSRISMTGQDRADFRGAASGVLVVGYKPGRVTLVGWTEKNERFQYCVRVIAAAKEQGASLNAAKAAAEASAFPPAMAIRSVQLKVGESATVFFPNMHRIAVDDPDIVDVAVREKDHLALKGKRPGKTWIEVDQADVTSNVAVFVNQ
jgi:Flp pilus assembly secretin CpaC